MKESVRKCLECTKPKCDNCVTKKKHTTNRITEAEFLELYNRGYSDAQIAEALDVPKVNVGPYRWRRGLKPHKDKREDKVAVVRCKDCIFRKEKKEFGDLSCEILGTPMRNDDFCSYGERGEK